MRGYNVGELAACRRYASAAAELRVPLLRQQAYAFAEWGSDLGSSGAPWVAGEGGLCGAGRAGRGGWGAGLGSSGARAVPGSSRAGCTG